MCLIIHKPASVVLTKEQIQSVYTRNDDGFGLMYLENDQVMVEKILPKSVDDIMACLEPHKDKELGIHFRMQTHGIVSLDNVHPFKIISKEDEAPFDAYLMHNGILSSYTSNTVTNSDTFNFVKDFISPLILEDGPEILHTTTFKTLLKEKISTSNRLLILTPKGFQIVNESVGSRTIIPGTWCSNEYAFHKEVSRFQGQQTWNQRSYLQYDNYPAYGKSWGELGAIYNTSRPLLESTPVAVKETKKEVVKATQTATKKIIEPPLLAKPILDEKPMKNPPKDLYSEKIPGIGNYHYNELSEISPAELFCAIVENPEDIYDLFMDFGSDIIESIDQRIFDEQEDDVEEARKAAGYSSEDWE